MDSSSTAFRYSERTSITLCKKLKIRAALHEIEVAIATRYKSLCWMNRNCIPLCSIQGGIRFVSSSKFERRIGNLSMAENGISSLYFLDKEVYPCCHKNISQMPFKEFVSEEC